MSSGKCEYDNIDTILQSKLTPEELEHVDNILLGKRPRELEFGTQVERQASDINVELKGYAIEARKEDTRQPRTVRVGLVQNHIVRPTSDPVGEQRDAILDRLEEITHLAGKCGVNIICFPELFNMPYLFCTREKHPWCEFAESAEEGPSIKRFQGLARQYNMVILCPIMERDDQDILWNTTVIISNTGAIIGKSRKNHIPRAGNFSESSYYMESTMGHPVFQTQFGRIAVNICFGHHHPLNWLAYSLNGAEIVFNPSATLSGLGETFWHLEGRTHALANGYFTASINRVGTETFPREFTSGELKAPTKDVGHFYGSSYIAAPDGRRTPALSRTRDGLLVTEIDLNLNRQTQDFWGFKMTRRLDVYSELLAKAKEHDYKRQIVVDASIKDN